MLFRSYSLIPFFLKKNCLALFVVFFFGFALFCFALFLDFFGVFLGFWAVVFLLSSKGIFAGFVQLNRHDAWGSLGVRQRAVDLHMDIARLRGSLHFDQKVGAVHDLRGVLERFKLGEHPIPP